MTNQTTIKCPNCNTEIDINEVLYHQLENKYKSEHLVEKKKLEAEIEAKRKEYKTHLDNLKAQEEALKEQKIYTLTSSELASLQEDFEAVYCDDAFGKEQIRHYAQKGYVMDPHTATCLKAYQTLKAKPLPCVLCSTAEWTKFAPTMLNAIKQDSIKYSDKEALEGISKALHVSIPTCISDLFNETVIHDKVVDKDKIEAEIFDFLNKAAQ